MAKLEFVRASGAVILSAILMGCASAPSDKPSSSRQATAQTTHRTLRDRTPSWQKYHVSGSRIARRLDANGNPTSADFVKSTTSEGLQRVPGVTMMPCARSRSGC